MQLVVSNKHQVGKDCKALNKPHILISIQDFGEYGEGWKKPYLPDCDNLRVNLLDICYVTFDDLEKPSGGLVDMEGNKIPEKLITDEDAKTIADFVKKYYGKVKAIVCQCHAGISRSSAVAAAIKEYYKIPSNVNYFRSFRYCPNRLVFDKVLDALEEKLQVGDEPKE